MNTELTTITALTTDTTPMTMTSTQLAELLGQEKKHINEAIRSMFKDKIEGRVVRPSLDARGYVSEYHLPELEAKMFVAKKDINYLEKITQFWIDRNKTPAAPQTKLEWMQMAVQAEQERVALELITKEQAAQLTLAAPKVEFANAVTDAMNTISIGELAKLLNQNGVNTGQNRLYNWMIQNGYLMKNGKSKVPTQMAMNLKVFKVTEKTHTIYGKTITSFTTVVTGKGQQYFINKFIQAEV